MPNLRNDYTEGVGKTVLDLFKKVFEIKKEHVEKGATKSLPNSQIGGTIEELEQGHVKLTKVEQYYDGTIYEGVINYNATHDISFNIKDRTKGHYNSQPTTQ